MIDHLGVQTSQRALLSAGRFDVGGVVSSLAKPACTRKGVKRLLFMMIIVRLLM